MNQEEKNEIRVKKAGIEIMLYECNKKKCKLHEILSVWVVTKSEFTKIFNRMKSIRSSKEYYFGLLTNHENI